MSVFFISLILHEVCNLFVPIIHFNPDELGAIAAAAKLAGCDWSGIWSVANAYYGAIFGIVYTPFFFLIDDPFVLYQIMLLFIAIVHSFCSVIAFKVLNQFYNIKDLYALIGAICCSFFTAWRASNVMNEGILILSVWCCFYFILKLQCTDTNEKKVLDTVLLNLFIGMALLSHTRSIIILISVIVVIVFYRVINRKHLVNLPAFIISLVVILIVTQVLLSVVKNNVFEMNSIGEEMNNTVAGVTSRLSINDSQTGRLTLKGITGFFDMLFGNIYTIFIISVGGVYLAGCQFINDFFGSLKRRFFVRDGQAERVDNSLLWGEMFCCVGLAASLVAYSIINWSYALAAKENDIVISYYLYPRYFGIFFGPLLVGLLVRIYNKKIKYWISSAILFIVVSLYCFWSFIYQFSEQGGDVFDSWRVTAPFTFAVNWRSERYFEHYVVAAIVVLMVFILLGILSKRKKRMLVLVVAFTTLYYQYSFNTVVFERGISKYTYDLVDSTYKVFRENEKLNKTFDEIYIDDEVNRRAPYILQFLMRDKKVILNSPEENKDDIIILAATDKSEKYEGFSYVQLDDNEFLYVKGEKAIVYLENSGILLKNVNVY